MLHQDKEFSASDVLFNQTIKIFYAVYSSLNFTVAAKKLGITQSAVSQCIASLENQLGFDLFDRTTRPLSVTYEGQVLYDRIQRQLTDFAGTLDALRAKNFVRTTVRVGVIESIGRNLCPELIFGMLKRGRRIKLHSGTSGVTGRLHRTPSVRGALPRHYAVTKLIYLFSSSHRLM